MPYNYNPYGSSYLSAPVGNLVSGIRMGGNNAIAQGTSSLMHSLTSIQQAKYAEEANRINDFNKLIDVSLKGVKGRFRDEAVQKRNEFIKNARDMAVQNQGRFTWDQQKNLESQRENLDNFVGMYQGVQDWAKKAYLEAIKSKDPRAREQMFKNIGGILDNGGNLQQTWEKTQDPENWYVPNTEPYQLKKDILGRLPSTTDQNGKPNVPAYKSAIKRLMGMNDEAIDWYKKKYMKQNPDATPEDFINSLAKTKADYVQQKLNNKRYEVPSPKNGGLNARGKYYYWKGHMYQKGDARPVVSPNGKKVYDISDLNIKLNSVKDTNGNWYKDAQPVQVFKKDGKWMATITHSQYRKPEMTKEKFMQQQGEEAWNLLKPKEKAGKDKATYVKQMGQMAYGALSESDKAKFNSTSKDQVVKGSVDVPLKSIFHLLNRHAIFKDLKYDGEDYKTFIKKVNSHDTNKNKENPLGLDEKHKEPNEK